LAEDLTAEDIQNAIAIEAFSEEYFALAKSLPAESRVWLSQAEPTIFKRDNKVYHIKPAV
jgi:hypothetical protein